MEERLQKAYFKCLVIISILLFYMLTTFQLNSTEQNVNYGYQILTEYTSEDVKTNNGLQGVRQDYIFELQGVKSNYNYLLFYTRHQNVAIYLDDECIYSLEPGKANAFGKTPGCEWNEAFFTEEDNGKTVRIAITPIYKTSIESVPVFYFGNRFELISDSIARDVPAAILGILVILAGIVFILFSLVNGRKTDFGKSLIFLGIFSFLVGLWKLTDLRAAAFFYKQWPALSYLPFLSLLLLGIPFILYIKEFYHSKESIVWYIAVAMNLVQIVVVVLLQLTGIADVRQTLISTHLIMALGVLLTIVMSCVELKRHGWSTKLKISMICLLMCFAAAAVEIILYYTRGLADSSIVIPFIFDVYIFVMGFSTIQDMRRLMDEGMRAHHYEQIAHHDQLTGLYNRTAFAETIEDEDFNPERYIVVMLDLNDLKKCNDALGHAKGDVYIRESAHIIQNCFGDIGQCFRVGGDEFCALIKNGSLEVCRKRVEIMHEKVEKFDDTTDTGINMQIACGYVVYDKMMDYDINDTVKRADEKMYRNKAELKVG